MQTPNLSGQQLGEYILGALLGEGGMAAVYESHQKNLSRKVAIKVLPHDLAQDEEYLMRFNREVQLAAHLEHPHILPVYGYGVDQGMSYIVMRLLTGGTLADKLRQAGRLPTTEALSILKQVAKALRHAHKQDIVHRDLKPSNILFDEEGHAYLADFGIAKMLQRNAPGITLAGQAIGTPLYMSPEQCLGKPVDARTDTYALGILAYILLTGTPPFTATSPLVLMQKHIDELPMPASTIVPALGSEADSVLEKALAKKIEYRYLSASQFVEELKSALPDDLEPDKPAMEFKTQMFKIPIIPSDDSK